MRDTGSLCGRVRLLAIVATIALGISTFAARAGTPLMSLPGSLAVTSSGSAHYSIPISTPPGTAGMVPILSLNYDSSNGDGIIGVGWSVSGVSSISRCPRTLAQDSVHGGVNYDANDRFCMDGQRLMLVSGTYGADGSEYRTEIDVFAKVVAHGSAGSGPSWFEVHTRDGKTIEYGNTTDSKVLAVGSSSVRLWSVDKITDTTNNYYTFTYNCAPIVSSACTDNDRVTNGEAYPLRIDYTGNTTASTSPYNSVRFTYASRTDAVPTYRAGSMVKSTVVLTNIKTYQGASVVLDYRLAYRAGTSTLRSRLTSVTLCDGAGTCLPATTFGWQGGSGLPSYTTTSNSLASGAGLTPGDFNGDGLTDLVIDTGTNCGIWYGSNAATFSSASIVANYENYPPPSYTAVPVSNAAPCFATSYTRGVNTPSDFDGDGRSDLIILNSSSAPLTYYNEVLMNNGGGSLNQTSSVVAGALPVAIGDFNGDGRMDLFGGLFYTPNFHYEILDSNGDGTFTGSGQTYLFGLSQVFLTGDFDGDGCRDVMKIAYGTGWSIDYSCNPALGTLALSAWSGGEVTVGDFNGDGLSDILVSYPSATGTLYLSTGTGMTATSFTVPSGWGSYAIYPGNWNGDGKDDIAIVGLSGPGKVDVFLSTGSGFTSQTNVSSGSGITTAIIADWNNDGADDMWLQGTTDGIVTFAFTPELMTSITDGVGATTTITYDRLNENGSFYVKGSGATYPTVDEDRAVYTVKQVDSSNGIGGNFTQTYAYAGAKFDLRGRGFLGFSSVTMTDSQTSLVTQTTYSTVFPYAGMMTGQTVTHGATTLSATTTTLENVSLGSGRYFVGAHSVAVTAHHDLNGASLPTSTTTYTYDCDGGTPCYGNVTVSAAVLSDGSSSTTTLTYGNDTTHWILGEITQTAVENVSGTNDHTRTTSYAHNATTGLITQMVVEPSNCEYKLQTDYTRDSFGNVTAAQLSGAGCAADGYKTAIATRTSYAGYDSLGEFKTSVTNALGQTVSLAYDARFGTVTSYTDLNSLVSNWTYDTFGRVTRQTDPDGNYVTYAYGLIAGGGPQHSIFEVVRTPYSSGGTINGAFYAADYDALGRDVYDITRAFGGAFRAKAVSYDANGRVGRDFGYLGTYIEYTYDDLGRVTQARRPDGSYVHYAYNGLTSTVTDSLSHTTTTVRNARGLVDSVTDAASHATTYTYDEFGNLLTVTDPSNNTVTNAYDIRGNKTDSYDPDMGHWSYVTDVLGQLRSQTDAKSQTTTLSYDLLGRATERYEGGNYTNWVYDGATNGVGMLQKVCIYTSSEPTCPTNNKWVFTYNSYGRMSQASEKVGGVSYTYVMYYNSDGRLDHEVYPSGFTAKYVYTGYGFLSQIQDYASSTPIWTANTADNLFRPLQQTFGNGVVETDTYDAHSARLTNVRAGPTDSVAQFDYAYDTEGNLTYRSDNLSAVYEKYCYDNLNRLTNSATAATTPSLCSSTGGGITSKTVGYDAVGNITSKNDVGTYSYPAAGGGTGTRPHAVASITGTVNGVTNPSYSYDGNGNLTSGAGRTMTYTAFNMVASIVQGTTALCFTYDNNHQRMTMETRSSSCAGTLSKTTIYMNNPLTGQMSDVDIAGGTNTWHDYVVVAGSIVAERTCTGAAACSTGATWRYFVGDHLGSSAVLMDNTGAVTERLSYDAWGRRRNSNGTDNSACSITSGTSRGYTGHEMLDGICEINANARIYDPTLGRFMTPDSVVSNPWGAQGLNRYSYVENGPLSATDPTGHYCGPSPGGAGGGCNEDMQLTNRAWNLMDALNNAAAFMMYVHSMGGWSGPFWDARFANGTFFTAGSDLAAGRIAMRLQQWGALGVPTVPGGAGINSVPGGYTRHQDQVNVIEDGVEHDGAWEDVLEPTLTGGSYGDGSNKGASPFGSYSDWISGRYGPFLWRMGIYHGIDGRIGVGLVVNYKGRRQVQWTQDYRIKGPRGDTGWQHDGDYPYYDSSNSLNLPVNAFWDTPTLGSNTGQVNVIWSARDQVIDLATGNVIYNFTWGFSTDANAVIAFVPPVFHK